MSDPPGTKWLKGARQPSTMLQLADTPTIGSWQFGLSPSGDGSYSLYTSPPYSDRWHRYRDQTWDLPMALEMLDGLRGDLGGE